MQCEEQGRQCSVTDGSVPYNQEMSTFIHNEANEPVVLPEEFGFGIAAEQPSIEPYATAAEYDLSAQQDEGQETEYLAQG